MPIEHKAEHFTELDIAQLKELLKERGDMITNNLDVIMQFKKCLVRVVACLHDVVGADGYIDEATNDAIIGCGLPSFNRDEDYKPADD